MEAAADEAFARLVDTKQDIPPGRLLQLWDEENLFQLPGTLADLDGKGRLIYGVLKAWYVLALMNLALQRGRNRMPYAVVDRFVRDKVHRGNPVFGENSFETRGGSHLPDGQRCLYNRRGFVDKFGFTRDFAGRYAHMAAETIRFSEEIGLAYTIGSHLYHRDLLKMAMDREIVERVTSLLGDNVVLLSAHTFTKKPGAPATPYHHGTSYQPIENTLTVFVGLTDCHEDNSCLRVIPGSEFFAGQDITENVYKKINWGHLAADLAPRERDQLILQIAFTLRSGELNLGKFQAHANFSLLSSRIKFLLQSAVAREAIGRFCGIRMELEPFEAFIFSERNFHGSGPNSSSRTRCALALRYAKGDELIDDRRHLKAFRSFGPSRLPGLDKIFDEFVADRPNAVIQVAGDPDTARRAGNNVICPNALMARIEQLIPMKNPTFDALEREQQIERQ